MKIDLLSIQELDKEKTAAAMCFEDEGAPLGIKNKAGKEIFALAQKEGFKGKAKQCVIIHPAIAGVPARCIVAGLGKKKEQTHESFRIAVSMIIKSAENLKLSSISIILPVKSELSIEYGSVIEAVAEACILRSYRFTKYQSPKDDDPKPLETVSLIVSEKRVINQIKNCITDAIQVAESVCFVRDLVNEPPGKKFPKKLAEHAKKLAKQGTISVKVYEKQDLEKMGMGALLGVSQGSHQPPVFIHMTYKPKRAAKKTFVFVGKGITFDSGGLNLKPQTAKIETMKLDMAGAAVVLGIFKLLPLFNPPFNLHGLIPACENLPGGGAIKPGDVVQAYNGKTIEILNTDAEGRLILADALSYGIKLKPDLMIDMATLTGAVIVAIGTLITGIMGTDQKAMDQIRTAGENFGEYFLQFPLFGEYNSQMKSHVADLKNIGTNKGAGPIIGGLFLKNFVEDTPWIHIDIAGTAYTDEELSYCTQGGTGVPLRTIIHWLLSIK